MAVAYGRLEALYESDTSPSCIFLSTPGSRISLWKTVVLKDGHRLALVPHVLVEPCRSPVKEWRVPSLDGGRPLGLFGLTEHSGCDKAVSKARLSHVIQSGLCVEMLRTGVQAHWEAISLLQSTTW